MTGGEPLEIIWFLSCTLANYRWNRRTCCLSKHWGLAVSNTAPHTFSGIYWFNWTLIDDVRNRIIKRHFVCCFPFCSSASWLVLVLGKSIGETVRIVETVSSSDVGPGWQEVLAEIRLGMSSIMWLFQLWNQWWKSSHMLCNNPYVTVTLIKIYRVSLRYTLVDGWLLTCSICIHVHCSGRKSFVLTVDKTGCLSQHKAEASLVSQSINRLEIPIFFHQTLLLLLV